MSHVCPDNVEDRIAEVMQSSQRSRETINHPTANRYQQSHRSHKKEMSLRQWKWKLTKPYNGFTSQERIRGWQVTHWLIDVSELPNPKTDNCACSICGKTKGVNYHNENYYEPWTAKLVCQSCHYFIHTRFRIEHALPVLKKRAGPKTEAKWVLTLARERTDLAEQLRLLHGDHVSDFPSLVAELPNFPSNQLHGLTT